MALVEWRSEFETGIPSIDYEHEHLITVINTLYDRAGKDAARDDVLDMLGEVHALIEAHFALEEKVMRDMRYADYPAHKADHDRLLEDIRDIMEDVEAGANPDFGDALRGRISHWFGEHFRTLDRKLHALTHGRRIT